MIDTLINISIYIHLYLIKGYTFKSRISNRSFLNFPFLVSLWSFSFPSWLFRSYISVLEKKKAGWRLWTENKNEHTCVMRRPVFVAWIFQIHPRYDYFFNSSHSLRSSSNELIEFSNNKYIYVNYFLTCLVIYFKNIQIFILNNIENEKWYYYSWK